MNYNIGHLNYMNYIAEKHLLKETSLIDSGYLTEADDNNGGPKVSPITKYMTTVTTNIQNIWNKFKQSFLKMAQEPGFKAADDYISKMTDQQKNAVTIKFTKDTQLPNFKEVYDFINQVKMPTKFDNNDTNLNSVNDYIASTFNSVQAIEGWNKSDNLNDIIMNKIFVKIPVTDPNKPKTMSYNKPVEGFENVTPAIQQQMTFIKDFDKNVHANLTTDINGLNELNRIIVNAVNQINSQAATQQQTNTQPATNNTNNNQPANNTANNNTNNNNAPKPANASWYFDSPYSDIFTEADNDNNNQNNNTNTNPQKILRDHVANCMKGCTQMLSEEFTVTNKARMICYRNVMSYVRAAKSNSNGNGAAPVKVEVPPEIQA